MAGLEKDLQRAQANRHNVPWIMVGAHRAFYTSYGLNTDPTFQTYFEPLFLQYHVDLIFTGHIHWYERMYSLSNNTIASLSYDSPPAPVYILTGSAGDIEGLTTGPVKKQNWTVYFDNTHYGVNRVTVYNNTVTRVEFVDSYTGNTLDEIVLTKAPIKKSQLKHE